VRDTDAAGHWTGVHLQRSTTDVSWYQAEPTVSLELLNAASAAPDNAILDVGGGASVLVDHLIQRGYRDLTVLDIAPPALDAARSRLGADARKATWIAADVLSWAPDRRYHIWHDRAVYHFLTMPMDQERYATVLRQALAPGGHAIIGTFAADGPETCSGLPVARYAPEALAAQFPGFRVRAHRREEHRTPSGTIQPFTWVLLAASTH
jgi:SAM-dependent methyltransferase